MDKYVFHCEDGDLISRQAVLDIFGDIHPLDYNARAYVAQIKELPSEKVDGDLISRQAVITMLNKIENAVEDGDGFQFNKWIEYAKELPSAEKTAEWIKQKSGDELFPEEIVCSKCYHSNSHLDFDEHNNPIGKLFLKSKYCPNCGAKMKKSGEE